jgi:DNA polymerase I-like protein with 3'-5' exonuclease and polymerase domains
MRNLPTLKYSGLTIFCEQARHDVNQLLDGRAGLFMWQAMSPIYREACDIRTPDDKSPLLEGTKVVLFLGEEAFTRFQPVENEEIGLNELRGTPVLRNGGTEIHTCSYLPQDAFDRKNYFTDEEETNDENQNEKQSEKGHQKTKRRNFKFWLYSDLRKVVRWVREGIFNHNQTVTKIYPTISEVIEILHKKVNSDLYIDIETDKEYNITCFGFSFIDTPIFVVPIKRFNNTLAYEKIEICQFIQALSVAFENNTVVVHNAIFDLFVLAYKYRIPFPRKTFDTMLTFHRCHPEIEKSLGHVISYLTDLPYHKNEGIFDPHNRFQEEELWRYNGKDIQTLILIHQALITKEITKLGPDLLASVNQANASIRPYLTMMFTGIKSDIPALLNRFSELQLKASQCDRILRFITKRDLNPRSSQQVAKYLYEDLGFEVPAEKPTEEKQLLKLLTSHLNKTGNVIPSVRTIIFSRGLKKAASSIKYRQWSNDGGKTYDRLSCSYNIAGTDTFRLGSRRLLKWKNDKNTGFGTNCQNRKKDEKTLYIPDTGKIFIQVDQAGAEALIVAYLCRNGNFRSLFLNRVKPHVYVALHLFKGIWEKRLNRSMDLYTRARIPDLKNIEGWGEVDRMIKDSDNWASDQRYYFIAKQVCHSSNYDIKAPTLQLNTLLKSEGSVALSLKQCKEFLSIYHDLFPEIRAWHQDIQFELKNGRILKNLFNYPRRFNGPFGDDLFKQGYAYKPQSTVGTITNIAITNLQSRIDSDDSLLNGVDLLNNSHDSILCQCPMGQEKIVAAEVKKEMEIELTSPRGEVFRMMTETQVGFNWANKTKYNEKGLEEIKS